MAHTSILLPQKGLNEQVEGQSFDEIYFFGNLNKNDLSSVEVCANPRIFSLSLLANATWRKDSKLLVCAITQN